MTLILGNYSKSHLVLAADGFCGGYAKTAYDHQKIYPISGNPIAICHHGQNQLNWDGRIDVTESEVLGAVVESIRAQIPRLSIPDLANLLHAHLNDAVRDTLRNLTTPDGVGFWVAGFGHRQRHPQIWEVFWPAGGQAAVEIKALDDIAAGGSAHKLIWHRYGVEGGDLRPTNLRSKPLPKLLGLQARVYEAAVKEQGSGPVTFGGHQHQLIVSRTACRWKQPPANPPIEL